MDAQLSEMIDAALRFLSQHERPSPEAIERGWPVLSEVLKEIGIFARDMERTEKLHEGLPVRQGQERELAAQRLYARLVLPPHADNIKTLPLSPVQRITMIEARPR